MNKDISDELKKIKVFLLESNGKFRFRPEISSVNSPGLVTDVVTALAEKERAELTVMATHGNSGLNTLLLGNHCHKMIDATKGLLMLVPFTAPVVPIKKIAFATDLKDPEKDLEIIYELIKVVRPLDAQLLITHITNGRWPETNLRKSFGQLLVDVSNKADYPNIFYRIVHHDKPEKGLEWLSDYGQVDVLAMVHRERGFLNELLHASHTKKMAGLINIPLLVIPENFTKQH
jgi:nucleotide-binding universal stress UspA family protein